MDRQQLERALRNSTKAALGGDRAAAAAARRFAGELQRMDTMPAPTLADKVSSVGKSALTGLTDPFMGTAQLLNRAGSWVSQGGPLGAQNPVSDYFDEQVRRNESLQDRQNDWVRGARDQAGFEGFDASRVATNIFNPMNAAGVGVVSKMAPAASSLGKLAVASGTAGALAGATAPVRNTDNYAAEKAAQIGIGAGMGAIAGPAVKVVGEFAAKAVNRLKTAVNKPPADEIVMQALRDAGVEADEIGKRAMAQLRDQVDDALKGGRQLDPAALLRKQDFEALGTKGTAGQIGRDARQFSDEINLSKTDNIGRPLADMFDDQNALINKKISDFSAGSVDDSIAGDSAIAALKSADDALAADVRSKYQTARQAANATDEVGMTGLAHDVGRVAREFEGSLSKGVLNQLDDYGLLSGKQTRVFNADEAENLLKKLNQQGSTKAELEGIRQIKDAIKRSVVEGLGDGGPYEVARNAAAKRFGLHDTIPALRDVVNGRAEPIKFIERHIINGKDPAKVRKMAGVLDDETKGQIKAQIGEYLRQKAFGQTADGQMSVASYKKALQNIGRRKLESFFDGSEVDEMFRIGRVAEYKNTFPAGHRVNTSNTSSAMYNLLRSTGSGIGDQPVLNILPKVLSNYRDRQAVSYALTGGKFRPQGITPQAERRIGLLSSNAASSGRGLLSTR